MKKLTFAMTVMFGMALLSYTVFAGLSVTVPLSGTRTIAPNTTFSLKCACYDRDEDIATSAAGLCSSPRVKGIIQYWFEYNKEKQVCELYTECMDNSNEYAEAPKDVELGKEPRPDSFDQEPCL